MWPAILRSSQQFSVLDFWKGERWVRRVGERNEALTAIVDGLSFLCSPSRSTA